MNSDILPSMILFLNRIQKLFTSWKINFSLAFSLVCISVQLFSQKGVNTLSTNNNQLTTNSNTFAVVVGISNYHDKGIPDLKYAHRDAIAFVDWLKGTGMVKVPEDHIQLLIDSMATRGQLNAALDGILDLAHEGDLVFLYFSGHGDVETKTIAKFGYLLCYDSPPNNYAAGAFSLDYLQAIVSTLANNKIKVIVIADACHAGKLAGSNVLGSRLTSTELARQYANEIKILSCQPNETSVEGEYWGGGRGVFSYYLTDGLSGFADQNEDHQIKLMELTNYLQTNVSRDVDPHKQIPLVVGDLSETLTIVDSKKYLAMVNEKKALKNLSQIDSKGIEEQTLAMVDSMTRAQYFDFKNKLVSHEFFCNNSNTFNCAEQLYERLLNIERLKPLHALMRRNYAAALQDEVQKALNALLADDPYEFNDWYLNPDKYAEYPKYLERAIELLGKEHYTYSLLYSQQKYFEAYYLVHSVLVVDQYLINRDSILIKAKSLLQEALLFSPKGAYICHAIGNLYLDKNQYQTDSVSKFCKMAIEMAPTWLTPYHDLMENYLSILGQIEPAEEILLKALKIKPESYLLNLLLSWVNQKQLRYNEADSICTILIQKRPDLFNAWSTMVQTHADMQDWDKVIELSDQSFKLVGPDKNWARWWYIKALLAKNQYEKAEQFYTKWSNIQFRNDGGEPILFAEYFLNHGDSINAQKYIHDVCNSYAAVCIIASAKVFKAQLYIQQSKFEEAKVILLDAIETDNTPDPSDHVARCWLATIAFLEGNYNKADSLYQEAFKYPLNLIWSHNVGHNMYGDFLLQTDRDEEAILHFKKSIEHTPFNYNGPYGMAKYFAKKGDKKSALDYLEKSLDRYYPVADPILKEPLFEKIRKMKRFKDLMKKHFKQV